MIYEIETASGGQVYKFHGTNARGIRMIVHTIIMDRFSMFVLKFRGTLVRGCLRPGWAQNCGLMN